jgi:hypothetical protein
LLSSTVSVVGKLPDEVVAVETPLELELVFRLEVVVGPPDPLLVE